MKSLTVVLAALVMAVCFTASVRADGIDDPKVKVNGIGDPSGPCAVGFTCFGVPPNSESNPVFLPDGTSANLEYCPDVTDCSNGSTLTTFYLELTQPLIGGVYTCSSDLFNACGLVNELDPPPGPVIAGDLEFVFFCDPSNPNPCPGMEPGAEVQASVEPGPNLNPTPEPSSISLWLLGLSALGISMGLRRKYLHAPEQAA